MSEVTATTVPETAVRPPHPHGEPVIRIVVSSNRVHCGKSHTAAFIAQKLREALLTRPDGHALIAQSQDGDLSRIIDKFRSGESFPPLKGLTFLIVDANGNKFDLEHGVSQCWSSPTQEELDVEAAETAPQQNVDSPLFSLLAKSIDRAFDTLDCPEGRIYDGLIKRLRDDTELQAALSQAGV